jgi:hypothetical protein
MTVDISKIKPGDTVSIWGTVRTPPENGFITVELGKSGDTVRHQFDAVEMASHTPKALAVGDRVRLSGTNIYNGRLGEIAALEGEDAWVRLDDASHVTVGLPELERLS